MSTPSARRLVFVFPGFEPLTAESNARRFLRGLELSAPLYDLSARPVSQPAAVELGGGLRASSFDVRSENGSAAVDTTVVVYGLDAIIKAYGAGNPPNRIAEGVLALGDFLLTGTFFRYLRTSWRYALFFLFPLMVFCAAAALGALAFQVLARFGTVPAALAGVVLCFGLLALASRQFHLMLLMDDWSFARDLARARSKRLDDFLARIKADVNGRIAAFAGDEVVFAAHSLGVVPALGALADTLRRANGAQARPAPLGLMTVGSSLLKIALHPAAAATRDDVKEVARSSVPWLDVQSVSDPISFYRSNPVQTLGLGPADRVRIMRISLLKQLEARSARASRFNLFKLHRQFVRAVEKRSVYSFHVILCGPARFASLVNAKRPGLEIAKPQEKG